jgi:hypothetical protein
MRGFFIYLSSVVCGQLSVAQNARHYQMTINVKNAIQCDNIKNPPTGRAFFYRLTDNRRLTTDSMSSWMGCADLLMLEVVYL